MSAPPALGPPRPARFDAVTRETLPNGLAVLVVRRPQVPRVELRLQVPIGEPGDSGDDGRPGLMARTLTAGTTARSDVAIGYDVQRMGGRLAAFADAEQLAVGGALLAPHLGDFLRLLAEVVVEPAFPDDAVGRQRQRLVQEVTRAGGQVGVRAREQLLRRLYGDHPYARGRPDAEHVSGVGSSALRHYHRLRVRPRGSALVLVGAVDPDEAVVLVGEVFAGWEDTGPVGGLHPPAPLPFGRTELVDRPGTVQTTVLMGGPAPSIDDPDHAALQVATAVLGGHASSRLSLNLRERNGYSYGAECGVQRRLLAANVLLGTDVRTDATAPALVEIRYELSRMATTAVTGDELGLTQRSLAGNLCLGIQTQAGLANHLASVATAGLGPEHLTEHLEALAAVTVDDVRRVAARYLAPRRLHTVLVADAAHVVPDLEAIDDIEIAGAG